MSASFHHEASFLTAYSFSVTVRTSNVSSVHGYTHKREIVAEQREDGRWSWEETTVCKLNNSMGKHSKENNNFEATEIYKLTKREKERG